jgi:hypothetical protein
MCEKLRQASEAGVELWLASPKCAPHLARLAPRAHGAGLRLADVCTIGHALELSPALLGLVSVSLS